MNSNDTDETPERDGFVRDIAVAITFLSRLPAADATLTEGRLARAARTFPIAGVGIGALAAFVYIVADTVGLASWSGALLAVAFTAWLTRGLHEDGLADVADGLGAASVDERLAIMRDSRIGTFGVLTLVLVVGAKIAALADLTYAARVAPAIIAAAALSRAAIVVLMARLPPARTDGMAQHAGRPAQKDEITAVAIGLAAAFLLLPWISALAGVAVAVLALAAVGWLARERLGGITGDVLGAGQQITEVAFLLAVSAVLT